MGRPQKPLERDGTPLREFAFWLRDLRGRSGLTYDELGTRTHYSTSTVQAATAGKALPTLRVVEAIVAACDGDAQAWRAYWTQIRRLLQQDAPEGIGRSILPPWAERAAPGRPGQAGGDDAAERETGDSGQPPADALDGWFCESCTALLRLDSEPIESIEQRVVVAAVNGLSELVTSVSVPRHLDDAGEAHGLDAELLYGGSLQLREQPFESYFKNVIVLPRPLRRGERHAYALRLRIPPQQPLASHYVQVPLRRTDYFEARVRFDLGRLPRAVWKLSDAPTAVIYERSAAGQELIPDRFGEVHVSFRDLRLGLTYGVCWQE
jgi:Helix-turn-helix domain